MHFISKSIVMNEGVEGDVTMRNALDVPFSVEGLPWHTTNVNPWYRIPERLKVPDVSQNVLDLGWHLSGAAVRFRTDAPFVVIAGELSHGGVPVTMNIIGANGFDTYAGLPGEVPTFRRGVSACTHAPSAPLPPMLAGAVPHDGKMRGWILNLPLYGGLDKLEIGIPDGYGLLPPMPHKVAKPVLFYGNSITQGAAASHPGNNAASMLCRAVDAEQINWGFSGAGRGEPALAEAIAELDLSALVLDYDRNTPSVEHLEATHERFFRIIREKHPDLPVLFLTCTNHYLDICKDTCEVIRMTYQNAVARSDKKVWFIDGTTMLDGDLRDCCTAEGIHLNDLGFFRVYQAILPVLRKMLGCGRS